MFSYDLRGRQLLWVTFEGAYVRMVVDDSATMIRETEQELCVARTFGMQIEIDPTVDFACKMLLGNPDHPEITIHFLNAILRLASPIVAVEIVNPIL